MIRILTWHNCYDKSLRNIITPESFAHPAKMALGLTERIFDHGRKMGYWQPGDLIVDPFGGIGTTLLVGAYRGYRVVGIELEPRFIDLATQNIFKNAKRLRALQNPVPTIIHGDSRHLREYVAQGIGAVTSPPYADKAITSARGFKSRFNDRPEARHVHRDEKGYAGAVTSPPYVKNPFEPGGDMSKTPSRKPNWDNRKVQERLESQAEGYGSTDGQLGSMHEGNADQVIGAITSPPYAEIATGAGGLNTKPPKNSSQQAGRSANSASQDTDSRYGDSNGQLAKLPQGCIDDAIRGVVTSPPWGKGAHGGLRNFKDPEKFTAIMSSRDGNGTRNGTTPKSRLAQCERDSQKTYGDSEGQIGQEESDTYWNSVAQVYSELHALLCPGGVAAIVVKDFVRHKHVVPLCDQTARLLEAVGFEIVERAHAMLVKERSQVDMFGERRIERTERKSSFRRLAEKKGSPRIDYEEVIFARKVAQS